MKPNAYRPIALECTISKIVESIVTELLSYLIETHDLLPANHFGACPQCTTEDAMMVLSENIDNAWKRGEIFTAVFMDMAGVFKNVHYNRLIHNMKQRHIPAQIVKLVQSFLSDRTTQLRFNGATSANINIEAGIPPGSPLSPILFMLYNAELLEIPKSPDLALGFIDDIAYGVSGLTAQGNIERLQETLSKSEKWKEKQWSAFRTEQIHAHSLHTQHETQHHGWNPTERHDNSTRRRGTIPRRHIRQETEISLTYGACHEERYQICPRTVQHRQNHMEYPLQVCEKIIHSGDKS